MKASQLPFAGAGNDDVRTACALAISRCQAAASHSTTGKSQNAAALKAMFTAAADALTAIVVAEAPPEGG